MTEALYIGLMSGTSADGIDAALLDFSDSQIKLLCSHSLPWGSIQRDIHALCAPGDNEIPRMAELDALLGEHFATAVESLLDKANIAPQRITAIGSHGQTIRHQPPTSEAPGFTLQIGDPNIIAERTGITTIADFRRRDMAVGGQGAPLVPAFHQAVFEQPGSRRVVVNIGGIANITVLAGDGSVSGYDTGPGNTLMDAWCQRHLHQAYDDQGSWAATGKIDQQLLEQMLGHPYFAAAPPKSTGRELFNIDWLEGYLREHDSIKPEEVQATLLALTAQTIVKDLQRFEPEHVYICGGGALNHQLMNYLATLLSPYKVTTTADLGVDPQWVEASAFAWLAKQTIERKTGNAPGATGASKAVVLGAIYPA